MTKHSFPRAETSRFARLDPAMFNKDVALFQPLQDGEPRTKTTIWKTQFGDEALTIICPFRLGPDDLGFFLALISFGGQRVSAKLIVPDSANDHEKQLALALEATGVVATRKHIRIETTMSAVLKAAGLPVKRNVWEQASEKLLRLESITCHTSRLAGNDTERLGAELLLKSTGKKGSNELKVFISERLTKAILGEHFITVDIPTYLRLRGGVARILFVRLCAAIRERGTIKRTLDAITHLVYGEPELGKPWADSLVKNRRHTVRTALKEITETLPGWKVTVDEKERYTIHRPATQIRRQKPKQADVEVGVELELPFQEIAA